MTSKNYGINKHKSNYANLYRTRFHFGFYVCIESDVSSGMTAILVCIYNWIHFYIIIASAWALANFNIISFRINVILRLITTQTNEWSDSDYIVYPFGFGSWRPFANKTLHKPRWYGCCCAVFSSFLLLLSLQQKRFAITMDGCWAHYQTKLWTCLCKNVREFECCGPRHSRWPNVWHFVGFSELEFWIWFWFWFFYFVFAFNLAFGFLRILKKNKNCKKITSQSR